MLPVSAVFDEKIVTYKPASSRKGLFGIVKLDYDQVWEDGKTKVSRNTRNGVPYHAVSGRAVPATCRFVDDTSVKANCEIQQWMFELCSLRTGISLGKRKSDWSSLTRDNAYITNFAGSWSRHDCINNTLPDEDFIQFQPMVCGGSLLKIVAENSKVYFIESINPFVDYMSYEPDTHKWLFYEPTLSARYWVEEEKKDKVKFANDNHSDKTTPRQEWYNEPFHHFGEMVLLPVMGMIKDNRSSTGFVNTVDKSRVRILGENEAVPNPFIMRFRRSRKNFYEGF